MLVLSRSGGLGAPFTICQQGSNASMPIFQTLEDFSGLSWRDVLGSPDYGHDIVI